MAIQIRARIDLMPVQPWPECGKPDRENKYLDKGYRVYVKEYEVAGTVSRVSRLGGGEWVQYLVVFDHPVKSRAQFELCIGQHEFFAEQLEPIFDESQDAIMAAKIRDTDKPCRCRSAKTVVITLSNLSEVSIAIPFPLTAAEHAEILARLRDLKPGMMNKSAK